MRLSGDHALRPYAGQLYFRCPACSRARSRSTRRNNESRATIIVDCDCGQHITLTRREYALWPDGYEVRYDLEATG